MIYYKFLSDAAALPWILSGELKFTPPMELNDPSELTPHFSIEEVRKSLAELRARGHADEEFVDLQRQANLMRVLAPEFQAIPVPQSARAADRQIQQPFYDNVDYLRSTFSRMVAAIATRVGVLCLTQRTKSLPMWVHYANRARGILIELRGLDSCFPGDETGLLNRVTKVNYRRDLAGVTFSPGSYRNIFFDKFKDWEYEEEFRVVLPLLSCVRRDHNGIEVYTKSLPTSAISSVIVGWRASDETKRLVEDSAKHAERAGWKGDVCISQFRSGEVILR